jgi:AraC-like DNA-binding protein
VPKLWTRPSRELASRIDRIWAWEGESELPTLLPGTGHEAFFNLGDPVAVEDADGLRTLPNAFFISSRTGSLRLRATGTTRFVCVRFRSGQLGAFCGESMREFADRFVPCGDVWGHAAEETRTRLSATLGFASRARIADDFARAMLRDRGNRWENPDWLDRSIERLYYRFSSATVDGVAEDAKVSRRQLERRFAEATGATPKAFQRTARFQTVLKKLLLARSGDYLAAALAAGYYDQAHFIHEFKEYTGETPGEFLRAKNFTSHFYNHRIAN